LKVFEKMVMRRIFGPTVDEMEGGWRKLQNEELHNLQYSPDIIRMIKSQRKRWSGHVARRKGKNSAKRIFVEDLDVSGRIILR
jgi:hypothetical protein